MDTVPDVDEVVAIARSLGMQLGADEARLYRTYLIDRLAAIDTFVQSRRDESPPPLCVPARAPGYRPSSAEDPLNAWMWKCTISAGTDGLLAGKTVAFKDHIAVAHMPMSFGSFALHGTLPDFDATVVTRVLEAGGTVVGKNTMNGLSGGLGFGGAIGDYGRPLNPHQHEHITGGSSSGSGAAVAAGEVDISFGGDQGGSIRIPAAFCGTLGLKPTFGLISHFGIGFGSDQSLDYTGPLARTSEDAAAALQATAGRDGYDPRQTADVPLQMEVLGQLADGVSGLRIGVLREGFLSAEADVRDLVMAAVDVLGQAGAVVSHVSIPEHREVGAALGALSDEGALALFNTSFFGAFNRTYYPASIVSAIHQMWTAHTEALAPRYKLQLIAAELTKRTYHGRVYATAHNVRPSFIRAYDAALANVDVLIMPTCLMAAPKYHRPADYLEAIEDNLALPGRSFTANTAQFNYTGHPALAVPVGKTSAGLPASMQVVGRFFDDPLLLRVAYSLQHAVDWDAVIGVGAA